MKHIQGSKNRVARHAQDAENVRRGMRALYEDASALRASLAKDAKPEEIVILERGFMALDFVARDVVAGHEQMIAMEQAFQQECLLWLNRKASRVLETAQAAQQPAICYVPSKAEEVETPKAILEGQTPRGEPTKVDPNAPVGFYTMADGTKVFVNVQNEPVPAPKDMASVEELVRAPENKDQGYIPMAPTPPTTTEVQQPTTSPEAPLQTSQNGVPSL